MGPRDYQRLRGVHPDLVRIVEHASRLFRDAFRDSPSFDLFVIEGLRTLEKQREYVASGASQTVRSRHLTGHAVDLGVKAGSAMRWEFPVYQRVWDECMKPAAHAAGVPIEWGGDWPKLRDGPHFQLPWEAYPA